MWKKESVGLTVSEGESLTIMEGNIAAGRHGTGAIAESIHPETTAMRQREITGKCGLLKPPSPAALATHLQQGHRF